MIEYRESMGGVAGDGRSLEGLVTPFNTWTEIGDKRSGGFDERVAPTSFTKTLNERDVVLIHNHDTAMPMARTSIKSGDGSLTLTPDSGAGLRAVALPVDTSYSRDVLACAKAGVIRGMSFGFEVIKDSWTDDNDNPSDAQRGTKRTIHEVRLHEVTTTAFPAYPTSQLAARDSINAARGIMTERANPATGNKPYGDVEYADPKNGKYPIDTEKHAKAAWAFINMPENADEYPLNGVALADVKAAIKTALRKFGVTISEDEKKSARLAIIWREESELLEERAENGGTDEDAAVNAANVCSMCGQDIPGSTPDNPGDDGDGDSDADDQKISRTSEPVESTRDMSDDEYSAWLKGAMAEYLRTR